MVSVRLAPMDSKMYLDGGRGGVAGEPWTHLLGPRCPSNPCQDPQHPPPQAFQELGLTCCEQEGTVERPRWEEARPREKEGGTEMGRTRKMGN